MTPEDDYREYERECAREDEHWLDEQIEAAVEAERARCLAIVEALAEEFATEILDAPYRIQTTEETRRRHGRIVAAMSKIRGEK